MRIMDFESMDSAEKLQLLSTDAVLLRARMDGLYMISLFQLDNFYAEVYYHTSRSFIKWIRTFEDADGLFPYLEDIDITGLLK